MAKRASAARRDAAALAAWCAAGRALGMVWRMCLGRAAGAEAVGLFHLLLPGYGLLLCAAAAGPAAAAAHWSARWAGQSSRLEAVLRRALRLFLLTALPLCAAAATLSGPLSELLGDGRVRPGLLLLLPCALLTGAENVMKQCLCGAGRPRIPAAAEAGEIAVRCGAAVVLLAPVPADDPARALVRIAAAMTVSEAFSVSVLVPALRRHLKKIAPGGPPERARGTDGALLSVALPAGARAAAGSIAGAAQAALVPRLLAAGGLGRAAAVAEYGVLCGMTLPLAELPCLAAGPLLVLALPRLARRWAAGDRAGASTLLRRTLGAVWTAALGGLSLLYAAGPQAARVLFGRPDAAEQLAPLALAAAAAAGHAVLSGAVSAAGRPGVSAAVGVGCDALELALLALTLGPMQLGAAGFAASVLIASLIGLALSAGAAARQGADLRPGRGALIVLLAAALTAQTCRLLRACLVRAALSDGAVLAGVAGFGTVIYCAALMGMGAGRR